MEESFENRLKILEGRVDNLTKHVITIADFIEEFSKAQDSMRAEIRMLSENTNKLINVLGRK